MSAQLMAIVAEGNEVEYIFLRMNAKSSVRTFLSLMNILMPHCRRIRETSKP